MLITAFKTNSDLYNVTNIPFWFNEAPTLEHFHYLFEQTLFTRWLLNSLVIGLCVVAITLVTAVPAGYSLARHDRPRGEALGIGIFLTYLVPPTLLFLPLSRVDHRYSACRTRCGRWCSSIRPSRFRSAPGC